MSNTPEPLVQARAGIDHLASPSSAHNSVAEAISQVFGVHVDSHDIAPAKDQKVVPGELAKELGVVNTHADWDEIKAGWVSGHPRTEKSRGFLQMLKERLLKQNPGQVLEETK